MHKRPYEIYEEIRKEEEVEELASIIDKPSLEPNEIWKISENNFLKWRKKHDYPKILNHFSNKLNGFEDWKKEFKLDNESLMSFGLSNCINPNPAKDKRKFIIERTWENEKIRFIFYQNIDGRSYNLGPNPVKHKVVSSFIGYIDWCNSNGIKIMNDWADNGIISRPSTSHPVGSPLSVKVSILDGLELLKIGGIEIKADNFGLIKPKYFEFVNANYLTLSGRIATQNHQLVFENSFVNKLTCDRIDLALVQFNNSSVLDFYSVDSSMQQWAFNFCGVTGKAYNSDFNTVSIYGGDFSLDFKDCTFYKVDARQSSPKDLTYESTYRTLKMVYANQEDDKKAIEYFLLEKAIERQKIKKEIFNYRRWAIFRETKKEEFVHKIKLIPIISQ